MAGTYLLQAQAPSLQFPTWLVEHIQLIQIPLDTPARYEWVDYGW
jgi:hypothetical protein